MHVHFTQKMLTKSIIRKDQETVEKPFKNLKTLEISRKHYEYMYMKISAENKFFFKYYELKMCQLSMKIHCCVAENFFLPVSPTPSSTVSSSLITATPCLQSVEYVTIVNNFTHTENVTVVQTDVVTATTTQQVPVTQTVTTVVIQTSISYVEVNVTIDEVEAIAEEYQKNLTIDTKSTSAYTRSKTSAYDKRESARFIGLIGTLFVGLPLGLTLLMDLKKLILDLHSYENIFKGKKKN